MALKTTTTYICDYTGEESTSSHYIGRTFLFKYRTESGRIVTVRVVAKECKGREAKTEDFSRDLARKALEAAYKAGPDDLVGLKSQRL